MATVDGQTKISNGVNVDTGGAVAALTEGFNTTQAAMGSGLHASQPNRSATTPLTL